MMTIYLDGKFLKVNAQIVEAFTPGSFKAKGVFETMLGTDGMVLDLDLHLKRLRQGLKALEIKLPTIAPSVLKKVLRSNHHTSTRVRLMVWQSTPEAGQAALQVHVMAAALPYQAPKECVYRVCLVKTDRAASARFANVKSLDYGLFAKCYEMARNQGFDEALLLNRRGHIFEASRANIFWIKDSVLYTPPLRSGCLNGITRQQIIKHANRLRTTVKEKDLTPKILKKADAAFLANSLIGIKAIDTFIGDMLEIKIA